MSDVPPDAPSHAVPNVWRVALVAAALAVRLYAVSLGGTYVFDDVWLLHTDDRVADVAQWGRYLTEGYNDGVDNLYRPLTSLSFAAQAVLLGTGENVAWAYHLVNVLLYALVCGQLAVLVARLGGTTGQALAAGALFAALPVHVEAVAYVAGRADLICAAGFLGGLIVLTRPLTPGRIAAFVALLFVGVGGKETGLLLPVAAAALYLARRRAGLSDLTAGRVKPLAAAVLLPLAAYLVWREHILPMDWPRELLDPTIQPMVAAAGPDRVLMPLALLGRYAALVVWPRRLALDYGTAVLGPPQALGDPYLWVGVAAVVWFAVAAVHAVRVRWAAGMTLLAAMGLTYAVVSNGPTLIGTVFGERLIFLPTAFLIGYVVLLAGRFRLNRGVAVGVVVALTLAGSFRALAYAVRWNDRASFYEYQARVQPRSVRTWLLLGVSQEQAGDLAAAAESAARAAALAPDYWDGWILASDVAQQRGDLDAALRYADRAIAARAFLRSSARRTSVVDAINARNAATRPAGDAP